MTRYHNPTFLILPLLLAACTLESTAQFQVQHLPLNPSIHCSGRFVAHDLPHVTASSVERVAYFISNGSGLAINDLDNDGDLDWILGNLLGPNQIFWNEGDLSFQVETLFEGSSRAITTVDVDGDGWLDIVYTARVGDIRAYRNQGTVHTSHADRFVAHRLLGADALAYAINWRDLDVDGDLDVVAASYDAAVEKQLGKTAMTESRLTGVYVYMQQAERFTPHKLANAAQALAVEWLDVDGDGLQDIVVGNDFDTPDYIWMTRIQDSQIEWVETEPFTTTTFSTMSFDVGDVDNDGEVELFAADMHPYSDEPEIMEQWQPVMDTMPHHHRLGDPQHMLNVFQIRGSSGHFLNQAGGRGIEASGWSWSTQFGDLDQDGHLDLYVVNGMAAFEIFSHLPNDELIEENRAYRNDGTGHFVVMDEWGLNSRYGGRSMGMADLDNDGDLDILINNLRAPAQIFENQLCQGASLLVDLRWPASQNSHAIGAALKLQTSTGDYYRDIRATSGYLSGDSTRVHFGFPIESELIQLDIHWPDGQTSTIRGLSKNERLRIERYRL